MEHEALRMGLIAGNDLPDTVDAELDADNRRASDLLEIIGREDQEGLVREAETLDGGEEEEKERTGGSFFMESLYFRSFGERPLLTREEETALAKRIDEGTRRIRRALRQAVKVLEEAKHTPGVSEPLKRLCLVKRLSGLSATALNDAERALERVIKAVSHDSQRAPAVEKTLRASLKEIKAARVILEEGKDELVRCNLRLVVDIAKHYTGRGLALLDLVQEGNIGLMKAAERYQYRKGYKFSTYATWWIRQGITRALADQARTIRVPVHQTEASHRILRVTRHLGQQLGRPARLEEVAHALRMRPERLQETMQAFQEPAALEATIGEGDTQFGELIPDQLATPPDAHVHRAELTKQLDRILSTLTPREQTVIRLRFGIGYDEAKTLEQIGQNLSVTRERIRQIEAKALKKLKTPAIRELFAAIK
ncbi:MAG: sigma-70 family RNA polymerase sigma factor [Nitrospira sp.]|nr:sigma-70 family RNA polymerase sigma factor [Nitrospira sp.]